MNDDVRNIVLGVLATGISAGLGWFTRTYLWRRRLARKQRFFGLPKNSECLLVVNSDAGAGDWSVARHDVFALLELSALIKDCGAHAHVVAHDSAQQGIGQRTEFCIGGPVSNHRMAAHLHSLLPGVEVVTGDRPDHGAFRIDGKSYAAKKGEVEYVLLARLLAAPEARPVFLACGQRSITNQAAARHLARHHPRLARRYGNASFCLLLKVVNSQAYGPDVVELVADVTRAATTRPAAPAALPSPSSSDENSPEVTG